MAEIALSAASVALGIVTLYLQKYAHSKRDSLQTEIQSMESSFELLKAYVEDNEGCEQGTRQQEALEKKVADIAYDIEDVLDVILLHSPLYLFHKHQITRKVHNAAHQIRHGFPHREISDEIARISKEIKDIISKNGNLPRRHPLMDQGPSSSTSSTVLSPPRHPLMDQGPSSSTSSTVLSPPLLDDEMIGYETQKEDFITRLLGRENRNLLTLAVVGRGGSGKTTFVKNVVWNRGILGKFDCHAWVNVSPHLDVDKLVMSMLQQFCSSRRGQFSTDAGSNALVGKRYIAILDGLSKGQWEKIKNAFPDASLGSRVIITIGSSEVDPTRTLSWNHVYNLDGLGWLQSWRLFCRRAFSDSNGECPPELKDYSQRIVVKCEGLPLALVAVGGALSRKPKLPNEWERFHDSLTSEISDRNSDLAVIRTALMRGYKDLSGNLKRCFLHFSIFPEDSSVERGRLMRLWVAERFAQAKDGKTAEEVAEDYLKELIHRNLVLVSKWDFDGRRPRNCRVQNLVLKFIIGISKDQNFASIISRDDQTTSRSQKVRLRRLAVHSDCSHFPQDDDYGGVRSMFVNGLPMDASLSPLKNILRKFKLLSTLDFQGAPLTEFPKEIIRLTLLSYLSFRETKLNSIPSSIEKFSYLETLDLKQTDVRELPKEICHLHNLCHLFAYKYDVKTYVVFDSVRGVKVSGGEMSNLKKLQDLTLVEVDRNGLILKGLQELGELRKLGLKGLKREHREDLSAVIQQNQKLRKLDLWSLGEEEFLELEDRMSSPPHMLERLYLKGRLRHFPPWISTLNNLLRIGLKWSKMQQSPLRALELLPNLIELQMVDCYTGAELQFAASGFKKLKLLLIEDLCELHTVVVQNGAMPELRQLSIHKCPKMGMLPLGMENLGKVEELILRDMVEEMKVGIRMNGEDRWRVDHIPIIRSFTLDHNQCWQLENLFESFLH